MPGKKKKAEPTSEQVLAELGTIAFMRAEDGGCEVKISEKMKALELIGKHLGMFEGRGEETQEEGFTLTVKMED